MKRSNRNPVASKQEIIKKSAPVFNIHGFEGTKVQMLIDATGFQKGGIYRHFTSKKELAEAAFAYNYQQLKGVYLKEVYECESAKDQLLKLINNFIHSVGDPAIQGGCPILNMAIEVDDTDRELSSAVKLALEDLTGILKQILVKGAQLGEFNESIDPDREAQFIIALVEGSIMMAKLHRKGQIIFDNCSQLLKYIQHFIFFNSQPQTSTPAA